MPRVKTGHTEIDIAAEADESHTALDHVVDRMLAAVGHDGIGHAVVAFHQPRLGEEMAGWSGIANLFDHKAAMPGVAVGPGEVVLHARQRVRACAVENSRPTVRKRQSARPCRPPERTRSRTLSEASRQEREIAWLSP